MQCGEVGLLYPAASNVGGLGLHHLCAESASVSQTGGIPGRREVSLVQWTRRPKCSAVCQVGRLEQPASSGWEDSGCISQTGGIPGAQRGDSTGN